MEKDFMRQRTYLGFHIYSSHNLIYFFKPSIIPRQTKPITCPITEVRV